VISYNKKQNPLIKNDLSTTLQKAMANPPQQQALQKLSDLSTSELFEFLDSETQEIRKDLDAILKRAVNALVEERISQDSFQSFRVIWQIAIDNLNRITKQ
ncbi:MAG: hypothetical protein SAK29_07450, partial [Scytonema sp. PMC 1069.18]|nr:hypothetical protein [Scytonema sp. PMC 1069.18]